MNKALVILSGGQDSVTCLGVAIKIHQEVEAISFNYGQKHSVELEQAKMICVGLKIPLKIVDLSFFGDLVTSALTGDGSVNDEHPNKPDLPASFVPNRNALFITIAHAYAQEIKARTMYIGTCQTDYSGYPDCRRVFIDAIQATLNTGYETSIHIVTPLMYMTKAETFALAEGVGFLGLVIEMSHTCYNGDHSTSHDWGFGCGDCPACELREKGYYEYMDTLEKAKWVK